MSTCISIFCSTRNGTSKKGHSKFKKNFLILIYSNLLLSSIFLYMSQTFTLFRILCQYFLTLLNLMNYQPCSGVNNCRPLIPLVSLVFWNSHILTLATTFNISKRDDDLYRYPASLNILE